jgi:hypothetical protein
MRNLVLLILFSLVCGSSYALTGFGESSVFSITEETLPVELSSFTATVTAQNYVRLQWTTQSESNLQGYYLYRDNGGQIANAVLVSDLIQPTNTSSQHSYDYTDLEIYQSGTYYYWLYSLEIDGAGSYHGPVSVLINLDGSDPGTPDVPLSTGLKFIYPNPFNPSTIISYQVKSPASVKIDVYNTRGQLVNSFARTHELAGQYTWLFEGVDRSGRQLSSGVYQVVMTSGKDSSTQKMVLMK